MAKQRFPMGMGGMGNANNMIKQAQKMQQEMLKAQEELEASDFEATAGGGAVCVKMSGKKELTEITIAPEACDPDDIEMLQDLIITAVNDVIKKVDDANAAKMQKLTGGLNIPGLF
ncbi:MAG: YbaB/EbfC family nucleoid-associated protein [Clostridia bacterium]|jgi:DNA-binding YbaB/EbfC family protein|nr:YbaB/EbfC family nucleoid-associated protein [Clostridia bacterium]